MKKKYLLTIALGLFATTSFAQHDHHKHEKDSLTSGIDSSRMGATMEMQPHGMNNEMEMDRGKMSHAFSLHLPMARNGSGTGWLPDASPVNGIIVSLRQLDVYAAWQFICKIYQPGLY